MPSYALGLEYDGSGFHGWQRQADQASVQGALEAALSQIANTNVTVAASGRTDAGVHATGQVVSFRTDADRPHKAWVEGTNSLLPRSVSVRWVETVPTEFHARFSAVARRYMYLFYDAAQRSALVRGHACFLPGAYPLDVDGMHQAAQRLLGEQDFSAFRASGCQARTAVRSVQRIRVHRFGQWVVLDIVANAFLLHMVRNIAAALATIGQGQGDRDWLGGVLQDKNRARVGPTAPPQGLYFISAQYPQLHLPSSEPPPVLRSLGSLEFFD